MPTSQPQRTTYRDRRINVMLQEGTMGGKGIPGTPAEPPVRQPRNAATFRASVLVVAIGTAALSALAVFFVLFRHDTARLLTNVPVRTAQMNTQSTSAAVIRPLIQEASKPIGQADAQKESSSAAPQVAPPAVAQRAIEHQSFRLSRGNRAQTVGGLRLRLAALNMRKGICTLQVAATNGRSAQYTVQLNKPLKVQVDPGRSLTVLVTGISKSAVSGSVTGS